MNAIYNIANDYQKGIYKANSYQEDIEKIHNKINKDYLNHKLMQYHLQLEIILLSKEYMIYNEYLEGINNLRWYQRLFRYKYWVNIIFKQARIKATEEYQNKINLIQKQINSIIAQLKELPEGG